jgi:hypothetical protein
MAVSFRIDPHSRIVFITTAGDSGLSEWTDVMNAILADSLYRPGFNFLSDRRQQSNVPAKEFAKAAADFLKQHAGQMGQFRWATLSDNPAVYGMQRMFTIFSEMRGVTAKAFDDYEEACEWLRE